MISVVILSLNEEKNIAATVRTLRGAARDAGNVALDIILVNDGSTDGTREIADQMANEDSTIQVIHHTENMGVGVGFRSALKIAKYPKFMGIPGDNDVSQPLLTKMISMHDQADLILAYFLNKEDRGRKRNMISTLYVMIYTLTFSVFIQYINSPAVYPTETLRKLNLKSQRFSVASEATIKSLRSGCSFCEVAGYMQTGLQGSGSLRWHNLLEAIVSYLRLVWEIYFQDRDKYAHAARRVRT